MLIDIWVLILVTKMYIEKLLSFELRQFKSLSIVCCWNRNTTVKLKLCCGCVLQCKMLFQPFFFISVSQSFNHWIIFSQPLTPLLSSSLTQANHHVFSSVPHFSPRVGTYETGVTAHPHCLLEFRYPECCSCVICMAGFGPLTGERECGFELFI